MLIITKTALELGFLYALVAMALFLSYRILDIADLTTDGCFVLGAAVSVTVTAAGHPVLAIFAAMLAGACAGFVTAFLQTKLGVPSIVLALIGSHFGTKLQLMMEEKYLQYLLLVVLPVVAFITLRTRKWPDETAPPPAGISALPQGCGAGARCRRRSRSGIRLPPGQRASSPPVPDG